MYSARCVWRYQVKTVFSIVARHSSVMMFRFPSLTPTPPKLFPLPKPPSLSRFSSTFRAMSLFSSNQRMFTSINAQPPSKCFLCMELFVLLLGVGYSFSSFPSFLSTSSPTTTISPDLLDSRNVVYRER